MNKNKRFCILLFLVLIMLTIGFIYNLIDTINFNKIRKSGDNKWKLVEERLVEMERKINQLEV